jgi:hypothetical protein
MHPAAHRSSSGAPTVFAASGLHTHVVMAVVKSEWELCSHSDLTTAGHHMRM